MTVLTWQITADGDKMRFGNETNPEELDMFVRDLREHLEGTSATRSDTFLFRVAELADQLPTGRADPLALQKYEGEKRELVECLENDDADTLGALLEAADCVYYAVKIYFSEASVSRLALIKKFFAFTFRITEVSEISGFGIRQIMDACIIKYTLRARPGNPKNDELERAAVAHLVGFTR